MHNTRNYLFHLYMAAFLIYLLVPLLVMGGAAFNDSKLPTVFPWKGLTDRLRAEARAAGLVGRTLFELKVDGRVEVARDAVAGFQRAPHVALGFGDAGVGGAPDQRQRLGHVRAQAALAAGGGQAEVVAGHHADLLLPQHFGEQRAGGGGIARQARAALVEHHRVVGARDHVAGLGGALEEDARLRRVDRHAPAVVVDHRKQVERGAVVLAGGAVGQAERLRIVVGGGGVGRTAPLSGQVGGRQRVVDLRPGRLAVRRQDRDDFREFRLRLERPRLLQQLLDVLAIPGKSADADADVRAQALGVNWRPEDIK